MERASRKRILTAGLALIAALAMAPARAVDVPVQLHFNYTRSSTAALAVRGAACVVTVPLLADGVAILEAAKTQVQPATGQTCISSYTIESDPTFGAYLLCVSGVCQDEEPENTVLWFWSIHIFGAPSPVGLSGLRAVPGMALQFIYEAYVCAPWPC